MKIRKSGKFVEKWGLDITCPRCGAELTLDSAEDMYKKEMPSGPQGQYIPGCEVEVPFCECPECKREILVKKDRIRADILKQILLKSN